MNFSVQITCEVLTLGFKTTPAALVKVKIGMDSLPFKIPFEVSRNPACQNAMPSFSISGLSATAGFVVATTDLNATGGNIQLTISTKLTIGKY